MSKYVVKLSTKVISYEWWGQQWCQNITNYADYYNRLERGRAYIRKGAIKDLIIQDGLISAMVSGSQSEPYSVEIYINPVSQTIAECTLKQIEDINTIKNGLVPENCRKLFSIDKGLFPTAEDIIFSCSCPDVAYLCKHVAAVLYAIGSILDQKPLLLFQLRGINVEEYLDRKLFEVTNEMLIDINGHSDEERIIQDDMLTEIFGIDIATSIDQEDELIKHDNGSNEEKDVYVIELLPKSMRERVKVEKIKKKNPLEGFCIRQFDLEGVFIAQFSSYEELEEQNSTIGLINIKRACTGLKKSAGGYQWKKVPSKEPVTNILPIEKPIEVASIKPVDCLDDDGNMVAHYESINAASRLAGVNAKSIREAATGVQKHAGGYRWNFSKESES